MQETHTSRGVDLAGMAKAAGMPHTCTVRDRAQLARLTKRIYAGDGALFATIKVDPEKLPLVLPPRDGTLLKNRFRAALLGPDAAHQ